MYIVEKFLNEFVGVLSYYTYKLVSSDKTIVVDEAKFISGESNILLVCGLSHKISKTVGKDFAMKNNATYIDLDIIWEKVLEDKSGDELKNMSISTIQSLSQNIMNMILKKVGHNKVVIEGIAIFTGPPNFCNMIISKYPCVFISTSIISAAMRKVLTLIKNKKNFFYILKTIFVNNRQLFKLLQHYRTQKAATGSGEITLVTWK